MFLMNKLVIHYGVLFTDFTAYWTQCCDLSNFQPTWHALKPYDKRNREAKKKPECSTSTHRAPNHPQNHPQAEFPNFSPTLRNSKVGLCRGSTRWHQKSNNQSRSKAAESALSWKLLKSPPQRFLEVGTELFEAIKNYDAEALIGLQKDQIFTFLQVEAQHSKLLLHSENILWYARWSSIWMLEVRTRFMTFLFVLRLFMSAFHPYTLFDRQVARIAKQLKASQLRWIHENHRSFQDHFGEFWQLSPGCCNGCAQSFRLKPQTVTPFGMLMIDVATLPRKICWTCPMYENCNWYQFVISLTFQK